jgi:hypothetical protein
MKNETAMTDLIEARTQRAKAIVHLAAHPDNVIVQVLGRLVLRVANHAVAKLEAKHGVLAA